MDDSSTLLGIAGSTLAGAVGFFVGFYGGFFLGMSIWGLAIDHVAFVLITGGIGTLAAGGAITLTVASSRKRTAFFTAAALGVVLVAVVLLLDTDAGGMAIGGFLLVLATSTLVRTGAVDGLAG